MQVEFSSAQVTKEGKTECQSQPIAPLFQLSGQPHYLRLIYLIRISQADHNMAIVAARQLDALDARTKQVQTDPADGCNINRYASCSWVPEGMAVRPEVRRTIGGVEKWIDAPR